MIDKNKWIGVSMVALAFALGGTAALADRSSDRGARMGGMMQGLDFAAADADQDGKVTEAELSAKRAAGIADLDSDGDGFLTAEELAAAQIKAATERAEARATRMVEQLDANGDGKLSAAELMVRPMPTRLFERLDADKDGALSEAELSAPRERRGGHGHGHGGHGKHRDHHGAHGGN